MRNYLVSAGVCVSVCLSGGVVAQEVGKEPDKVAEKGAVEQPAAGGAKVKEKAKVQLIPRFAAGQVALFEVATTDTKFSPDLVRRRARLEVLGTRKEGTVLRWTDFWEGTDKSVRPEPLGESDKRTKAFTIDVLVPHDGDDARADDVEAARAEYIARYTYELRERKVNAASLANQTNGYRAAMATEPIVHSSVLSEFGLLFSGLNLQFDADQKTSMSDEISLDPTMPGIKRSFTVTLTGDAAGEKHTLKQKWTVAGEAFRPWMRVYLKRTLEAAGEKPTDAQLTDLVKGLKGLEGENASTFDRTTGWPVAYSMRKQSTEGSKVRTQTAHFTLVDGPDPVVPVEPAVDSDEYVGWLVGLVSSEKQPLRRYGLMAEEGTVRVTPSQRRLLLKAAAGTYKTYEREMEAGTIFARAATFDMPEDAADTVAEAYPSLTRSGRAAVLFNALRAGTPWSLALFDRLLALSPDEKSLARLPLDEIEDAPELSNAALKSSLARTKAGDFDWAVVYSTYELAKEDELDAALKPAAFGRAAEVLGAAVASAKKKQKPAHGAWVYDEAYEDDRAIVSLAADVLGYGSGDVGLAELRLAAQLTDMRVRGFAVGALVRRGEKVEEAAVESVCASTIGWRVLVPQLLAAGKTDLVPAAYATLESAAKADMVGWLLHPSEVGREPEEIELVKAIDLPAEAGVANGEKKAIARYYVFKFRSDLDAFKKSGWMMGLSGPWDAGKSFSQSAGGHTFSRFESIDKGTPEEQAGVIIKQMNDAWKKSAEKEK